MRNRKYLWILVTIIILVIIDQVVKMQVYENLYNSSITVIRGVLNLTYLENTGVAFGVGANSTILITIANMVIITILICFIVSKKEEIDKLTLIGLSLITAGGIGNVLDRAVRGHVIDYIDISPLFRFPVFNFADICIVMGATIVFMKIVLSTKKETE